MTMFRFGELSFGLQCCVNWRVLYWSTGPGWRNALISMVG